MFIVLFYHSLPVGTSVLGPASRDQRTWSCQSGPAYLVLPVYQGYRNQIALLFYFIIRCLSGPAYLAWWAGNRGVVGASVLGPAR